MCSLLKDVGWHFYFLQCGVQLILDVTVRKLSNCCLIKGIDSPWISRFNVSFTAPTMQRLHISDPWSNMDQTVPAQCLSYLITLTPVWSLFIWHIYFLVALHFSHYHKKQYARTASQRAYFRWNASVIALALNQQWSRLNTKSYFESMWLLWVWSWQRQIKPTLVLSQLNTQLKITTWTVTWCLRWWKMSRGSWLAEACATRLPRRSSAAGWGGSQF